MLTMLLAGERPFDLDELLALVPAGLQPELLPKGRQRHLVVKNDEGAMVAQIQDCDEEADIDTMDDLARRKDLSGDFQAALDRQGLRFLIVTCPRPDEVAPVIQAFVAGGQVRWDCSDGVRELK